MSFTACVPFSLLSGSDLAVAGGKGANLAELVRAGFPVPDGFVITTDAYRLAVSDLAEPTQEAVASAGVPGTVHADVMSAYERLGAGRVAVRSSATAEDLPGAAFAGQQDTFLGIEGADSLIDAVRRCWASLWTERAVSYRARLGIDDATVAIAVVVQRMAPSDLAGVMFTADPVTGARDRVVIDSSPGLGESVVAGLVTPDHAVLGPDDEVVERRAGRADTVIRESASGGTETVEADGAARLTEAQLAGLAALGRGIAEHFGRPQDIEWAVAGDAVAILQARPMTALPPPPRRLTRRQRLTGPVIVELVPRRPYPMEVSAWIEPNVGRHMERLLDGVAGVRVRLTDSIPATDAVVQEFVPPNPEPSRRTPRRIARTVSRFGCDPRAWADDPRLARFRAAVAELGSRDLTAASWAELLAVPPEAGRASDLMTELRIEYLPSAAGAMVRLRLLLTILRRRNLFASLLVDAKTATQEANAALGGIADLIATRPRLAQRARGLDGRGLLELLRTDPDASPALDALDAFLARYGHRETVSVLLPRDPTWSESPETVTALVSVLLTERVGDRMLGRAAAAALATVQRHPLVRLIRAQNRVARLVDKAAAGAAVREDTHFELTRGMPPLRRAVLEMGRRLAGAGAIPEADDVWYLTLEDLRPLAGPDDPAGSLAGIVARRRQAFAELAGSPLIAPSLIYPAWDAGADGALVSGVGGGSGRATGPVRVIAGPDEFAELRSGEVLVCTATNPSWTPLFARAAAVVVDNGGLASHAAIVAREYGIPAVMGTGSGTTILSDGQMVLVDGDRGVVVPDEA